MTDKVVYLDLHDLMLNLPDFDVLLQLREYYPNFKVTCFVIPDPFKDYCEIMGIEKEYNLQVHTQWAEMINSFDWLEIGIHGYTHVKSEMECTYEEASVYLRGSEDRLKDIQLNYKKIFVAPYWRYSVEALELLRDKGYIVEFRKKPRKIPQGLKYYLPNWFINRPLPKVKTIFGNGHLTSFRVRDGIKQCYSHILKVVPKDSQFNFISSLYEPKT